MLIKFFGAYTLRLKEDDAEFSNLEFNTSANAGDDDGKDDDQAIHNGVIRAEQLKEMFELMLSKFQP